MTATSAKVEELIARLRNDGWCVAVHNDYRLRGSRMTFWLWTHPNGRWIKGEGITDQEALEIAVLAASTSADLIASLNTEVEGLRAALTFYRDGWDFKTHKKRSGLEWFPKEELLDDCGNIARAALSALEAK